MFDPYGFLTTFEFRMIGPFLLFSVPRFLLLTRGQLEWKRNKKLKADEKVVQNKSS